ncbi:PAS domain S-box-containing protein [Wenyingzhuangia heitensis]|uniref:histidine kinase n=1 Tax=Wenyingzhuangia heitensis TaxID=1487859 RepID=A0ABX0U8R0_9FLAO|nr:PAS domain-containing sensor histidine kinase [Wenyingzhuangia heitensis]NIJ45229.1 PAS domain S-box-containing protein [Wenyingzhuangia heitensis]
MPYIDLQTIYFSYILVNIINLILSISLYFQIKKRFPGTLLIVVGMFMTTLGNVLVFFRNSIPNWLSIPIANVLIVSSMIALLIGFERFLKKKETKLINYILISVFFLVHTYFTYINPNLKTRHINITIAFLLLSLQVVYLMLVRTPLKMRKITRPLGYVFLIIFISQVFRLIYLTQNQLAITNTPKSDSIESLFVLFWELIVILLAYSLSLMYNERLIIDVNNQEEKFSKAFHAAPFVILLSKLSTGEIFEVNKKIQSICGYLPNELFGLTTVDLGMWKQPNDRFKFIALLKKNKKIVEQEYQFRKKSGELFSGLISAKIININGEQCIISVINDITIRKNAERNLKKSEASLRELNSTKDKFFSIIAHDLKSPFNGILGFSQLLSEQVKNKDYESIEEYAEIINTSSHHSVNLLSNLMEWSMSQTGKMEFYPEYVDIVLMIKSTLDLLKISSNQKSINIQLDMPTNQILYVDKVMIEVVLRNLISNAIKFTPNKGTIHIYSKENNDCYVFSIIDTGIGIDEKHIDKLFRIDSTYTTEGTNNERGTGLGLILCKDFIDYHKGKIGVKSKLGVGSEFYFSLPQKHTSTSF